MMDWIDLVYLILLIVFSVILSFIFGYKLRSAGDQLGNSNLKQAGDIVIFMVIFMVLLSLIISWFIYSPPI